MALAPDSQLLSMLMDAHEIFLFKRGNQGIIKKKYLQHPLILHLLLVLAFNLRGSYGNPRNRKGTETGKGNIR
jgi:hypothetical protein